MKNNLGKGTRADASVPAEQKTGPDDEENRQQVIRE